MSHSETYDRQFVELSRVYLKSWEGGGAIAIAFDGTGRRVLIGLTADETLEFLRLHTIVYDGDPSASQRDRHAVLRGKFYGAKQEAFREYVAHRRLGIVKH